MNYNPKQQEKHKRGPKRERPNPKAKAHTLMTQSLTVDTANALLRLLPHLSPPESQRVPECISSLSTMPPPPLQATFGIGLVCAAVQQSKTIN